MVRGDGKMPVVEVVLRQAGPVEGQRVGSEQGGRDEKPSRVSFA